ncbi:hypothetical protein GQ43DRAFT_301296 [Delitschia confertaspora ATCC 74209]|uniref:Uncharacterized protein n=1 Tax=Delitschia confertaspora ATCC 74209 TaxID=1513339 RepID=A0A9P4MX29_9PLEO|nr:hypothetical protein GQ43DRAFT_301296 [Delitschia confertaspora ATCC 74209]
MEHKRAVIAIVILVFGSLAMALVAVRFLWKRTSKRQIDDTMDLTNEKRKDDTARKSQASWWQRVIATGPAPTSIPSLTGLIKAGDEIVFSSALFDRILLVDGESYLERIYSEFAETLASKPGREKAEYSSDIKAFISRTPRSSGRNRSSRKSIELNVSSFRTDAIDGAEKGLRRSRSKKRSDPLVSGFNRSTEAHDPGFWHCFPIDTSVDTSWTSDLQRVRMNDGRLALTMAFSELQALALMLGIRISAFSEPQTPGQKHEDSTPVEALRVSGSGAFAITLQSTQYNQEMYHFHIEQTERPLLQYPSRGSGYSTIHAKHLPYGALPFSRNGLYINSILITSISLRVLKSGQPFDIISTMDRPRQISQLLTLPSSKTLSFHKLEQAYASSSPQYPANKSTIVHAIAGLPLIGGLVPLVTEPVLESIQFIASGGLEPGRLLQRLEDLIHKVHRQAPHLRLFGPILDDKHTRLWIRERKRLGTVRSRNHGGNEEEAIATSVARVGRYVTLLERLMGLLVEETGMDQKRVKEEVMSAMVRQIGMSWQEAVDAEKSKTTAVSSMPTSGDDGPLTQSAPHNPQTLQTDTTPEPHPFLSHRQGPACISPVSPSPNPTSLAEPAPPSPTSAAPMPRPSTNTFSSATSMSSTSRVRIPDLARQVEVILKSPLSFDVHTIARVARLVLVAWTLGVGVVDEPSEAEHRRALDLLAGAEEVKVVLT